MRVIWDLDGMGYDLEQRWLDRVNEDWGTTKTKDDVRDWDFALAYDGLVPKKEVYKYLHEPGMFNLGAILPGFREALMASIEAGDEALVVSSPSGPLSAKEKLEWCAAELPFLRPEDVMLGAKKSALRADAILDDKPETLMDFRRENPGALCAGILYPYNASVASDGIFLVPDYRDTRAAWSRILDLLASHRAAINGTRL